MHMNLKPNKYKRISDTMTMAASLGFIGTPKILGTILNLAPPPSPPPNLIICSGFPLIFWSEIFICLLKIREGCYHD